MKKGDIVQLCVVAAFFTSVFAAFEFLGFVGFVNAYARVTAGLISFALLLEWFHAGLDYLGRKP